MSSNLTETVREKYAAVARGSLSTENASVRDVATAFGYSLEELRSIPADANMALSCGNPVATANLQPGEVVVDLGCGGGLDVFLAAKKVGPAGKAIGIDMTADMIARAKKNAERGPAGEPYRNVEFHLAAIDALPLADGSVDCVISNCVINLASDKPAVFREIARVLKPGGRLAVSDIALKRKLPAEIERDVMAFVGCIAGAILVDDYVRQLKAAGFHAVEVVDAGVDLNAYGKVEGQSGCCSPEMTASAERALPIADAGCCGSPSSEGGVHAGLARLLSRYDINDYAASVNVFAIRPESL
jgi:SAM-dependent methyltransferase